MGISQGLDSGATNSSTEEIRVIELSINNETRRKAAPVLMGFTLVLVPPWVFFSFFLTAQGMQGHLGEGMGTSLWQGWETRQ